MGIVHGAWCVGCCWALMVVLFAVGVMSITWMVLVAAIVFAEKVLPVGERAARVVAVVLIALGVWVAVAPGQRPRSDPSRHRHGDGFDVMAPMAEPRKRVGSPNPRAGQLTREPEWTKLLPSDAAAQFPVAKAGRFMIDGGAESGLTPWRIRGAYFESCNCEAICPCRMVGGVKGGRSTHGICFGVLSWLVADGHAGEIDLTGLAAAFVIRYDDDEPRLAVELRRPRRRARQRRAADGAGGDPHRRARRRACSGCRGSRSRATCSTCARARSRSSTAPTVTSSGSAAPSGCARARRIRPTRSSPAGFRATTSPARS